MSVVNVGFCTNSSGLLGSAGVENSAKSFTSSAARTITLSPYLLSAVTRNEVLYVLFISSLVTTLPFISVYTRFINSRSISSSTIGDGILSLLQPVIVITRASIPTLGVAANVSLSSHATLPSPISLKNSHTNEYVPTFLPVYPVITSLLYFAVIVKYSAQSSVIPNSSSKSISSFANIRFSPSYTGFCIFLFSMRQLKVLDTGKSKATKSPSSKPSKSKLAEYLEDTSPSSTLPLYTIKPFIYSCRAFSLSQPISSTLCANVLPSFR